MTSEVPTSGIETSFQVGESYKIKTTGPIEDEQQTQRAVYQGEDVKIISVNKETVEATIAGERITVSKTVANENFITQNALEGIIASTKFDTSRFV